MRARAKVADDTSVNAETARIPLAPIATPSRAVTMGMPAASREPSVTTSTTPSRPSTVLAGTWAAGTANRTSAYSAEPFGAMVRAVNGSLTPVTPPTAPAWARNLPAVCAVVESNTVVPAGGARITRAVAAVVVSDAPWPNDAACWASWVPNRCARTVCACADSVPGMENVSESVPPPVAAAAVTPPSTSNHATSTYHRRRMDHWPSQYRTVANSSPPEVQQS